MAFMLIKKDNTYYTKKVFQTAKAAKTYYSRGNLFHYHTQSEVRVEPLYPLYMIIDGAGEDVARMIQEHPNNTAELRQFGEVHGVR